MVILLYNYFYNINLIIISKQATACALYKIKYVQ